MILSLTFKSILNRKTVFLLSLFSIAISVVLLLGIDRTIKAGKSHFLNTINETDMIVASSNGSLDIFLNLVFHIGDGLKEVGYSSYEDISKFDEVEWSVPLSVGDSFRGFDVVSTNTDFFKHYKYSSGKLLEFESGGNFSNFFDLILGADVAKKLHLRVGDKVYLSHSQSNSKKTHIHKNRAFTVSAILKKSSTPNDSLVFMQLKADEAIHLEWQSGRFVDMNISSEELSQMNIKPKHISGMLLGLKYRSQILEAEDKIDNYKGENLKAVIPAKALTKLYKLMENLQEILMFISSMVFIAAIFTMLSSMFSTLNDRRREIAILRSLGASVKVVFTLFATESFLVVLGGIIVGNILLSLLIFLLDSNVNISYLPDLYELLMLGIIMLIAVVASVIPAIRSYKYSLKDGLTVKI
jgi:putative ABC transport system permease protein